MTTGKSQWWIVIGGVMALISVMAGAFGDHLLRERFAAWYGEGAVQKLANWQTASRYLMYAGLGCCLLGCLPVPCRRRWRQAAGMSFLAGGILFSGGLYGNALTNISALVHVVPIGGLAMMAGWILLVVSAFPTSQPVANP